MTIERRMRSVSGVCRGVTLAAFFLVGFLWCVPGARGQDPGAAAMQANQQAMQAAQQANQQAMQDMQTAQQIAQQANQQAMANASSMPLPPLRPQSPSFPRADKPLFSLRPGEYAAGTNVTIEDNVPKAMILYTTDGTAPTMSSKVYTGPIVLGSSVRLRAIALSTTHTPSRVASAKYVVR
jgi:hypothetical protein